MRRRLGDLKRGLGILLVPSLVTILVVTKVFYDPANGPYLLVLAAIQIALVALSVFLARNFDPANAPWQALYRRWKLVVAAQFATSIGWMILFPYLAIIADPIDITFLGIAGTAIYCSVLMAYRSSPGVGIFHILGMSVGLASTTLAVAGLDGWPSLTLLTSFGIVLMITLINQERSFRQSVRSEFRRRENEAMIRVLLDDYEEQSSDSLWMIGPNGNLRDVSERFAALIGIEREKLEGLAFLELFKPSKERDILARRLSNREPFRDLLVGLMIDGNLRYWRLSARPRDGGAGMAGVARDVTSARLVEERVAFMAHYDNLTGVANRHLFNERLRGKEKEGTSAVFDAAVFYIDLDDFKAVNDARGHALGDALLREAAARLEQEVRKEDLVARLGGDEFAVLINTRSGDGLLLERAHRFLSVMRAPFVIDGQRHRISASVGIARSLDGDCDADELMRRADLALHMAKKKGRDDLALFDPSFDRAARERREIETDLGEALNRGQMYLDYQPVADLRTGEITAYEALLRWRHPQRGIIAPNEFLPFAEETGQILSFGDWVIQQALFDASRASGDFRIAINLSPTQVKTPGIVGTVAQAIDMTHIAPERVELEITEHVLMDEDHKSLTNLMALRDLGVKIAIDDFGTGFSSLSYLRRFPFDRLKIDRTFVTDVVQDIASQAIVSSITRLADAFGVAVTAEGIESPDQLDMLRKLGADEAQGFLIAEPSSPECMAIPLLAPDGGEASTSEYLGTEFLEYRRKRQKVTASARARTQEALRTR
ncbi:EAL domain-containing protein [Qipengyuania flava]|nr:EAL domain-containing protein [Qipengyuania flava]